RQQLEKAPPGAAAEVIRDLEMVTAILNRAHRRLAGAAALELDAQQREAARQQIERMEKQLQRIDAKLLPEQARHVEQSTPHYDSGPAHAGSGETRDRGGAGDFPCSGAPSPALKPHRRAGVAASRERRTVPPTDPGAVRPVPGESRASP